MRKLELKIPPVAVFLLMCTGMFAVELWLAEPLFRLTFPRVSALLPFGLSGVVGIAGVREFRKAKTTVNPVKPEKASTVVASGIFAYSRNPMYLALLLLLLSYACWLQNAITFAFAPLFVLYMNRFQIQPEERALEKRFGSAYLQYKQKVRRWI
ncbi:isoprenylcysteine carboxylmethyltransferase family protein [Vibrio navarrensis]|uniref:methyltransferase family protein n=1 Tax=Vibrio navarrensis TaxID=29495 RepID=UPI001558572B|nr:isoprenylcysteine carboxylmethyltransferase family protein [Vibrio navarrensis]EHA1126360.1 isoprenylcysteine carboxylmethyltransferase family protein [Vibrio navarrensis]